MAKSWNLEDKKMGRFAAGVPKGKETVQRCQLLDNHEPVATYSAAGQSERILVGATE